jgi:uncharacterized SAM-binding protein YcdF (DUF218 family)
MPSLNDLLASLELGIVKGYLTALVLPPVPFFFALLAGMWWLARRRSLLGWASVLTATAAIWFSCTTLVGVALVGWLVTPPPALSPSAVAELRVTPSGPKTAIVVLGGGRDAFAPEYGVSNLNALGLERLRYGIWLSRATGLPVAFSGGVGHGAPEGSTEAEIAARIAANEFQRPLKWLEQQSRDTSENATYTIAMLRPQGIERIVLVTHGFHMLRAVAAFERAAQRVGAPLAIVPAPLGLASRGEGWMPSAEGLHYTRMAIREWIGRWVGA